MLSTSCHCNTVRLVLARRPSAITECNCSICRRYGARWGYYSRKSVKFVAGADALQSYERGRVLYFDHCRQCGCVMLYRPKTGRGDADRLGINLRQLDDPGVLANIKVQRFDGAKTWKDVGSHVLTRPWW